MSDRDLKETILDLLRLGYEGTYWDYKEDYTDCKEDKLIDIICMANNIDGHEAYLIYGADDSGNIKGIRGESVRNLVSLEAHASLDKSSICRNLLSILGIFCCRIFLLLLV